jgi:hypothetical protein
MMRRSLRRIASETMLGFRIVLRSLCEDTDASNRHGSGITTGNKRYRVTEHSKTKKG